MSGEELKLLPCPFCGGSAANVEYDEAQPFEPFGLIVDHKEGCFLDYKRDFDAAITAWNQRAHPLPEQPQEGWQPWESAPEDGTAILAYRPDAGVFTAHYVEEDAHLSNAMNPPEGDFFWFTTSGEDLTGDLPTHWMPLPSPPSTETKESGDA